MGRKKARKMTLTLGMGGAFWQRENLEQFWSTFTRIRRLEGCWTTGFCFLLIYLPYKFLIVLIALYPSYLPPPLFFFPKALDVFSSKAFTLCVSSHFPDLPSSLFFWPVCIAYKSLWEPWKKFPEVLCEAQLSPQPESKQCAWGEVRGRGVGGRGEEDTGAEQHPPGCSKLAFGSGGLKWECLASSWFPFWSQKGMQSRSGLSVSFGSSLQRVGCCWPEEPLAAREQGAAFPPGGVRFVRRCLRTSQLFCSHWAVFSSKHVPEGSFYTFCSSNSMAEALANHSLTKPPRFELPFPSFLLVWIEHNLTGCGVLEPALPFPKGRMRSLWAA